MNKYRCVDIYMPPVDGFHRMRTWRELNGTAILYVIFRLFHFNRMVSISHQDNGTAMLYAILRRLARAQRYCHPLLKLESLIWRRCVVKLTEFFCEVYWYDGGVFIWLRCIVPSHIKLQLLERSKVHKRWQVDAFRALRPCPPFSRACKLRNADSNRLQGFAAR